jgi:hypothetical protein
MTATVAARPKADAEATTNQVAAPTVGLCLYANAKEPAEGGWACVDGGIPFSIQKPADLPSNVLWITSADYSEFRIQGHRNVHNLRQPTYFRTDLKQMATDLGLEIDGANAAQSIVPLSQVVARIARVAHGAYKWRTAPFSEDNLADSIKASMPPDIPPARHMVSALNAAFQRNSKALYNRYLQDSFSMTLRTNRMQHAQRVLNTPIPDDAWEELPGHVLPASNRERLQMVLDADRPVLAEVTVDVSDTDSNEANLTAFGSQMGARMPLRRWMAHPELIWLSEFARINIHSIYISATYRPLSESMRLPAGLVDDPYMAMSYSAGIVAENHLQALSSSYWNAMTKQYEVTARGVWLRAVDRAESFLLARRVLAAGFDVFGYTMGSVTAKVRRIDLMQFGEFVLREGLITPSLDLIMKHYGDEDDGHQRD